MKIRTDFVTNSSSSSFIAFGIYSKELESFLSELNISGILPGRKQGDIILRDGCVSIAREIDDVTDEFFYSNGWRRPTKAEIASDEKKGNSYEIIKKALKGFIINIL